MKTKISDGKNVDFAGTISVYEGKLYKYSNNSGNYKPSPDDKGMFIDIMKKIMERIFLIFILIQ